MIGTCAMWIAGPYAGGMISAGGDKMIACVNAVFPSLRFMSDGEREALNRGEKWRP